MKTYLVREAVLKYRQLRPRTKSIEIKSDVDAFPFFQRVLPKGETREHFMTLSMDGTGQLISVRVVSIGSAIETIATPNDVFQAPNIEGAYSIILAHNHPGGKLQPSRMDKKLTEGLIVAGKILGISVLDHMILGRGTWLSLRSKWPNMFPSRTNEDV